MKPFRKAISSTTALHRAPFQGERSLGDAANELTAFIRRENAKGEKKLISLLDTAS